MHPSARNRHTRGTLVMIVAATALLAGCGMLGPRTPDPVPAEIRPQGAPVARGFVNGVAWTMHAWTEDGTTCTSFDAEDGGWAGCGNGTVEPRDLHLSRQVGGRIISITGLVGRDIVKIRVRFGDGSASEYPTLPSPVAGSRVAAIVLPAAPVPGSIDGIGADGSIVASTDL